MFMKNVKEFSPNMNNIMKRQEENHLMQPMVEILKLETLENLLTKLLTHPYLAIPQVEVVHNLDKIAHLPQNYMNRKIKP